jgi:hypothetical protein
MPRIFIAASLLLAAVFAGAFTGLALRPDPRPANGKPLSQEPGSMNRGQPRSSPPVGIAIWRIDGGHGAAAIQERHE